MINENLTTITEKTRMEDAALALAEKGWAVLPVHSPHSEGGCTCSDGKECSKAGKHPRTPNGFYGATTDSEQIRNWFNKWPESNIGIRTGRECGIVALDVDLKTNGDKNLALFEQEHGPLPQTVEVITGSGGRHIYFTYPDCDFEAVNEIAKGVEVKADGRYLVAPPSIHLSGNQYRWKDGQEPWAMELAPLPDWVLNLANKKARQKQTMMVSRTNLPAIREVSSNTISPNMNSLPQPLKQLVIQALDRVTVEDDRNNVGFDLACQVRDLGFSYAAGEKALRVYNSLVPSSDHPYTLAEALASLRQAFSHPMKVSGNVTRLAPKLPAPLEVDLRDYYLDKFPNTKFSGGHWRRYANGIWNMVEEGLIKKEISRTLEEAQVFGARLTSDKLSCIYKLVEAEVWTNPNLWDSDPDILVCSNETLRISTGERLPHSPEHHATTAVPFPYDPDAKAPTWEKCLKRLSPEIRDFLQEFAGYCLTPDTRHEISLWFYGQGGSGKSTILEGLIVMLGSKCGVLGLRQITQTNYGLSAIVGKTLVIANEQPGTYIKSTDVLKNIISGEDVTIEDKYAKPYAYKPKCKIAWAMNEKPRISDPNDGLFRRVKVLEFPPPLAEKEQDPNIKKLLHHEGSGILNWALEGLRRLNDRGRFQIPKEVRDATEGYRKANDVPGLFVDDWCEAGKDQKVRSSTLYQGYVQWCKENNHLPVNSTKIKESWRRLGFKDKRESGALYWLGLKLTDEAKKKLKGQYSHSYDD